jgi:hypothetical protein
MFIAIQNGDLKFAWEEVSKMAKNLKKLKINTLGSVDTPANQHGQALLFKRAGEPDVVEPIAPTPTPNEGIISKFKKFALELIAYGKSDGAEDFNTVMQEAEIRDLLWEMNYALTDSVFSIFEDDTVTDKKTAVVVSLQQYLDTLAAEGAFDNAAMALQLGKQFTDQIKTLVETDAIAKGDQICPTCGVKMTGGVCPDCGYKATVAKAHKTTEKKEGDKPMKIEDLMKSENLTPEVKAFLQSQEDSKTALEKSLKDTQDAVELEKAARLDREYLSKAQSFTHLAQKPEEFGPILKGLATKAPDEFAKLEPLLKGWNEAMSQSALFTEVGKTAGSATAGSAEEEINKRVETLMKADTSLNVAIATTKVLEADPSLYKRYNDEQDAE